MLPSTNKHFNFFLLEPLQFKTPEEDVSEDVICGSVVVLQYCFTFYIITAWSCNKIGHITSILLNI